MQVKAIQSQTGSAAQLGNWLFTEPFSAKGSFDEQVRTALAAMKMAASVSGFDPAGFVKCDVIVDDLAMADTVYALYREVVGEELPAFRIIQEAEMRRGCRFTVELTAVKDTETKRFFFENETLPCAVKAGDFVFTSQMLPEKEGSLDEQAAAAIGRMLRAAALAGAGAENFVKNMIFLADCGNFADFNKTYASTFMQVPQPPARSLHGVPAIRDGRAVALEGIAYLGQAKKTISVGDNSRPLPFCQAMCAGEFLFVSGQVGLMAANGGYHLTPGKQIPRMLEVLDAIAAAGGVAPSAYIKVTTFARKLSTEKKYRKLFAERYPDTAAVLSFFAVTGLAHPAILIESDILGYLG